MNTPLAPLDAKLDFFRDPIPGAEENGVIRVIDWILRGVGQVVFQSNWLSGIIILVAIAVNSPVYLVAAILGTAVSTFTAVFLGVDRGLIDAGLLGFNGTLVGIGLAFYQSTDFTNGNWPDVFLYVLIVVGSAMSTVILSAIASLFGGRSVPTLTAPFVLATWLILFGVYAFIETPHGTLVGVRELAPLTDTANYTFETFWNGTFKGIAEIYFQDNWITGLIMAIGVFVNTRIGGIMMIFGPALAAVIAMIYGADEGLINAGLFGFNASLTAIAIGGFFFLFDWMGAFYMLLGVVVTTFAWPAFATLLAPMGMPTFTFPFVVITWFFLLAKPGFSKVRAVAPADATYPEDIMRRNRSGDLAPGY